MIMSRKTLKEITIDNNKYKIILDKYNITSFYCLVLKASDGKEEILTINPQNIKVKPKKNNVLLNNKKYIKLLVNENIIKQDCIHILNNTDTCGEFKLAILEG